MWKSKISLEEAVDLSYECEYEENHGKSRWTEYMWYVVKWEASPTGYASFSYEVPLSNENQGIFDVNEDKVELEAVEPYEITVTKWRVIK